MSSHMLAPHRRAWQDTDEREPEPAEAEAAVVCELCGRETFVGTAYMTARSQIACPKCWFGSFRLEPLP